MWWLLQYKGKLVLWILLIWQASSLHFCLEINLHHLKSEKTWSWPEGSEEPCKARALFYPYFSSDADEYPEKIRSYFHLCKVQNMLLWGEARNSCSHKLPTFNHLVFKSDRTSTFSSAVSKVKSPGVKFQTGQAFGDTSNLSLTLSFCR